MEPLLVGGTRLRYNVHSSLQDMSKEKVQKIAKSLSLPIEIAILNTKFSMNAAMIIRQASCEGIRRVHIIGPKACDMRPAVGGQNYVDIVKAGDIDPSTYFDQQGLIPILVEQGGEPLEDFNFKPLFRQGKTLCIVMGNESSGLPPEYLKQRFPRITISQMGVLRSMNVQMAAGIVIYEMTRQWRQLYKEI
jgi:tRNA G18 (ribose-2'-O)-methylase SpoU